MLPEIIAALGRGDLVAAFSAATAAVAAEPENPQAHHLLSLVLKRQGNLESARAASDRAIGLAPDNAMFQLSRAALAMSENDLALAEQGMKEALALDPNQLPAYVALINLAMAQGRNNEARTYLTLAKRVDATHPHVLVAEGHVAQLGGRSEEALRCFTAAVEADPGLSLAQVSLGLAFMRSGHWAFAEQALNNALALDVRNPGVLNALMHACLQQGKLPEAEQALDHLIAVTPEARYFSMRADLRLRQGKDYEALADLQQVAELAPGNLPTLNMLVPMLVRSGRLPEAIARVEAALALAPLDGFWRLRLNICGNDAEQHRQVLERWLAAAPESAICLDQWASFCEQTGDLEKAQAFADQALAINPTLAASAFVKIRSDFVERPQAVIERLEELLPRATTADAQRMSLAWQGLAHDRLGHYAEAANSWRQMVQRVLPQWPLPNVFPAVQVPEGEVVGRAIWAPPGVRLDRVFQALQPVLGERLLVDRTSAQPSGDGFGLERDVPGGAGAGSAARWEAAITARGLDPQTVVDWMPHWDAYTAAALRGLTLTAVLSDPRDAFLNWMVHGSAQGFIFIPDARVSAEWLARTLEALADHRDACPDKVNLVPIDAIDETPGTIAIMLQAALALPEGIDPALLGDQQRAAAGVPNQFPSGYWRHYRSAFADEFARLTPVSQRMGYPAE